jgi:hypothetical protein
MHVVGKRFMGVDTRRGISPTVDSAEQVISPRALHRATELVDMVFAACQSSSRASQFNGLLETFS